MRKRIRSHGGSASGRYQYIYKTLKGLVSQMGLDPETTVFDESTQDKIALFHLKKDHKLDKFLDGQITSANFLKRLSKTWAGLPDPSTGQSYYLGLGDNKANVKAKDTLAQLDQLQIV
jgi:muramidase (phage lysozyme)